MPKLVFHDSDGVEKNLQLGTAEITIGRASECEVQTHDAMVSRKHARIVWDGGSYWIEDLGSSNGVFLGQEKVQRAQFRPGDVLTCGSLVIRMIPEARRSQPQEAAFEPPAPRPAPVDVRPASRQDAPQKELRRTQAPPPAAPDWGPPAATSSSPALAGAAKSDAEVKQLRVELQRETERREQAEAALLTAEQRKSSDDSTREIAQLRRKIEQRDADLRRAQEQLRALPLPSTTAQSAPAIDLDEVGEAVALFNDALAEVKAHLRAASDESKLLSSPSDSVKVVRDALRGALEELDQARTRLREMVRQLGLPEA